MVDYDGKPISIGDRVTFIASGKREFNVGTISKIGKVKLTILHDNYPHRSIRNPCDVIKEALEWW